MSFNGKARFTMDMPADAGKDAVEAAALAHQDSAKWLAGKTVRKVIVVPGKIVNIVVGEGIRPLYNKLSLFSLYHRWKLSLPRITSINFKRYGR